MSLDDLMAVWRSQDAAPLHGVNETLLRLALRQDEAKLQRQRRWEEFVAYLLSAFLLAVMTIFALLMFYNDDNVIVGWDYGIPIVGAASALLWVIAFYVNRRAQTQREQHFGESLRDQVSRRIAQLDNEVTNVFQQARVLLIYLPPFICATAMLLASMRINSEPDEPFDEWPSIVGSIVFLALSSVLALWAQRRVVKRDLLPRKERLEALLKEIDGD